MKILHNFIMNDEAILFYPVYDQFGKLFTGVLEDKGPILVDMGPSELIDYNLKYYGSSLRGAHDGARMILGEISMKPIVVNERLDLYWFPSKSPSSVDCLWFALHHVKEYKSIGKKQTHVLFSNGSSIEVDASVKSFAKKVKRAYKLKGEMERRTKEMLSRVAESDPKFHIRKKSTERNYELIPYWDRNALG